MNKEKTSLKAHEAPVEKDTLDQLTKVLAKGAGISFFGDIFGKGINFVSQVVIARLLGAELFGLYALALVIFNVAQSLSGIGLSQGGLRYVSIYNGAADKPRLKGTIIQCVSFPFIIGSVLALLVFLNSANIANAFNKPSLTPAIKTISLGIPFMASMMVAIATTRGFQKMQYFVYVKNLFHPIVNLTLVVLLYWLGLRLMGALLAWIIAAALGLVLAVYFMGKEFPEFGKVKAFFNCGELLKFSCPLAMAGLLQMLFMRIDIIMLGYFRPVADVGIYNAAAQVVIILSMGLMAFSSIFSPIVVGGRDGKTPLDLDKLLKTTAKWTFVLTLPVFIIMVLACREILSIFGPEFSAGRVAFLILTMFNFLVIVTGPIKTTLIMSGKQMIEFLNIIGGLILNVILNLTLIPAFGIAGAALATGISVFGLQIARLIEVRCLLRLWPFSEKYLKSVVAGIVSAVITILFRILMPELNYALSLFATAVLVIAIFSGTQILLKLDEEDKLILQAVIAKIKDSIA